MRIRDAVDAADALGESLQARNRGDLDHDRMLLFAVVRAIEILGEAASKISAEPQAQIVGVP